MLYSEAFDFCTLNYFLSLVPATWLTYTHASEPRITCPSNKAASPGHVMPELRPSSLGSMYVSSLPKAAVGSCDLLLHPCLSC